MPGACPQPRRAIYPGSVPFRHQEAPALRQFRPIPRCHQGRRWFCRASGNRRRFRGHGRPGAHERPDRCPSLGRKKARSPTVDFDPGSSTRSASPGNGIPGCTVQRDAGSSLSGSRSSKLAIREITGTTIFILPLARTVFKIERILGRQLAASANHGTTPSPPAGALGDLAHAVIEQARIAAEAVDEKRLDAILLGRVQHCMGADHRGNHTAPVDVSAEDTGSQRLPQTPYWRYRRPSG
jgi:hypothetical protein